jgi:NADH-quinone oxidoreductase subunit M
MTELHWTMHAPYPLLAVLQLLPLLGALLLVQIGERRGVVLAGRAIVGAEFLVALDLYRRIDVTSPAMQFAERFDFIGPFGYHAGADGLTVLFVLLCALVSLLLSFYPMIRGLDKPARLMTVVLAVEGVVMSLLVTLNLLWFVLACVLDVALVGYLLWHWATSPDRDRTLARFYQFQGTGLLLLLAGALVAGWVYHDVAGGRWSFDLLDLSSISITGTLGTVMFFLLFYGFAIRTPLFPMHGWLPAVAHHGNVATAPTLLLGIKIGIYGMLRFVFPVVPQAVHEWHNVAAAFAITGIFYAAFLAMLQTNLRKLMAFAVVSHTSLVVLGLFTLHPLAFQGATLLAVNFGLAITVMLFMVGFVYRRTGTTSLARLGGLMDRIPAIGGAFFIGGLAILGMPGTPGFDAAHLLYEAAIGRFGALPTVAAALGNVVAAGFLLLAFQRAFLASRSSTGPAIERTQRMEFAVAITVVTVLLGTGFHLEPWFELIEAPLAALAGRFGSPG